MYESVPNDLIYSTKIQNCPHHQRVSAFVILDCSTVDKSLRGDDTEIL